MRTARSLKLWRASARLAALAFALPSCGPSHSAPQAAEGGAGEGGDEPAGEVQLGVPGGDDGLSFEPLGDGAELRLETFGQGGTHVLLGVRCIGFGSRAFVSITLRDSNTGNEIVAPAPARPQLLFCAGQTCDLVPVTVMAGGLTRSDEERDGLPIVVSAEVHNQSGLSGTARRSARLSTADL